MAKLEVMLVMRCMTKVFRDKNSIYQISWPKCPQNEVLCSVIRLCEGTNFDLGPYDDLILTFTSKNEQNKEYI